MPSARPLILAALGLQVVLALLLLVFGLGGLFGPQPPEIRFAEVEVIEDEGTPPGMVFVPPGRAVVGTTEARLNELLEGRSEKLRKQFIHELPEHTVGMPAIYADRYEVSNAQYLYFLQDTARASYDTSRGTLADLEEVAGFLMGALPEHWELYDKAWRQLYRGNRAKLHAKMPLYVRKDSDGRLDEVGTEEAFHRAPLPPGLVLEFYDRTPPKTWPDLGPAPGFLDHPVASVSYDDAAAFAEWAGKHVLTETEWEWVARGPEGFIFPWGDAWFPDASRANWGGLFTREDLPEKVQALLAEGTAHEPYTMPVDSLPQGRSWCGVHHMLGNVAEWTSSWFGPYPGSERDHAYMGEFVKIIRGASHVDQDPLALRPAARNFVGAGTKAPPRPGNRFEFVGFRCGWYGQPGKDPLGPIIRRVSRGRRVTHKNTALDRYVGAAATRFAPSEDAVENHVYVVGKAHSIVFVPLTSVLRPGRPDRVRTREHLLDLSSDARDPAPLGVLHSDVPLEPVDVPVPPDPAAPRPAWPAMPTTAKGVCPPGTYVLAIWWSRSCLCNERLEFQCFLSKGELETTSFDVKKLKPEKAPYAEIEVEPEKDFIFLSFAVPVGGKKNDEDLYAWMKTLVLPTKKDALTQAGTWRR